MSDGQIPRAIYGMAREQGGTRRYWIYAANQGLSPASGMRDAAMRALAMVHMVGAPPGV